MNTVKKILLVEDEPIARMVNTQLLKDLGYMPDIAVTGEEAVEMSNKDYDIIFMDIGLPGINGLEATKKIREIEAAQGKRATIIALTAYSINEYRDKCIEAGLDNIANKPISIEKLRSLIDQDGH